MPSDAKTNASTERKWFLKNFRKLHSGSVDESFEGRYLSPLARE
jgi:hypothetical protein